MATTTPNYGLRKPTVNDNVNVALDISGNMDLLDAHDHSGTYAPIGTLPNLGSGAWNIEWIDTALNLGGMLHLDHYGVGGSNSYAIDIRNRVGADSALIVHQYSDFRPAVQFDNTRSQPVLRLRNASNATYSPGTEGSGDFLDLWGFDGPGNLVQLGGLDQNLKFVSKAVNKPFTFQPSVAAIACQVAQTQDAKGLYVTKSGAAAHMAVDIVQASPAIALNVTQNAANHGIQHTQGAGGTGFYGINIAGYTHGGKIAASQNGGTALIVQKDGTGAGTGLQVLNKGTGTSILVSDASATRMIIDSAGKITVLNGVNCTVSAGTGTPEGAVTAPIGSTFHRTDGGAATSFYVKESGAGNTGWVAK